VHRMAGSPIGSRWFRARSSGLSQALRFVRSGCSRCREFVGAQSPFGRPPLRTRCRLWQRRMRSPRHRLAGTHAGRMAGRARATRIHGKIGPPVPCRRIAARATGRRVHPSRSGHIGSACRVMPTGATRLDDATPRHPTGSMTRKLHRRGRCRVTAHVDDGDSRPTERSACYVSIHRLRPNAACRARRMRRNPARRPAARRATGTTELVQ
jgi:hypothetical protein